MQLLQAWSRWLLPRRSFAVAECSDIQHDARCRWKLRKYTCFVISLVLQWNHRQQKRRAVMICTWCSLRNVDGLSQRLIVHLGGSIAQWETYRHEPRRNLSLGACIKSWIGILRLYPFSSHVSRGWFLGYSSGKVIDYEVAQKELLATLSRHPPTYLPVNLDIKTRYNYYPSCLYWSR